MMQNQLQSMRMDHDKMLNQEREQFQRNIAGFYEMYYMTTFEATKQAEIVKRLNAILGQIIPLLPAEHQHSAINASERARQITQQVSANIASNIIVEDIIVTEILGNGSNNDGSTTTNGHDSGNGRIRGCGADGGTPTISPASTGHGEHEAGGCHECDASFCR